MTIELYESDIAGGEPELIFVLVLDGPEFLDAGAEADES